MYQSAERSTSCANAKTWWNVQWLLQWRAMKEIMLQCLCFWAQEEATVPGACFSITFAQHMSTAWLHSLNQNKKLPQSACSSLLCGCHCDEGDFRADSGRGGELYRTALYPQSMSGESDCVVCLMRHVCVSVCVCGILATCARSLLWWHNLKWHQAWGERRLHAVHLHLFLLLLLPLFLSTTLRWRLCLHPVSSSSSRTPIFAVVGEREPD